MIYFYSNLLSSQNITSRTNIIWAADITEIEIDQQNKVKVTLE